MIFFLLFFFSSFTFAQNNKEVNHSEMKLKQWFDSLYYRNKVRYLLSDEKKLAYADSINKELLQILQIKEAFNYPFDSLTNVGKIVSDDSLVRVFTYNILLKGGKYQYYGFIQKRKNKLDDAIKVFKLIDKSDSLPDNELEYLTLNSNKWYGASYYQIVPYLYKKQTYYILIGWDGFSYYVNRKIVEILFFNRKGDPIFGKNVFQSSQKTVKRLIFNYSIKASMTCRFDSKLKAIVFDHLVPSSSIYKGMYEFYGPNGTYDGYFLNKSLWIFKEDIELRNPPPQKK